MAGDGSRKTYKDENAPRVSLPVLREFSVLSICFGKINRPQLIGSIAVLYEPPSIQVLP